jgi:tetratricopeptide (TPR) repeat protein
MKNWQYVPKKYQKRSNKIKLQAESMKKILIPILMGAICSPVMAEDVRALMHSMGYTDPSLFKHAEQYTPKPKNRLPKEVLVEDIDIESNSSKTVLSPDDFLHPRVYAESESSQMIPMLIRLQKKNPTSAKITRKLAVTCLKSGQPREALYWYIQTYQRDRSDHESLWNMAALAYQLKEEEQTRKYLTEYVNADPHSAWGRLAKDFLKGRFSSVEMQEGFKTEFSRFGVVETGASNSDENESSGNGLMIIEGRKTSLEELVDYNERTEPVDEGPEKDTVKGKTNKVPKKNARKIIAEKRNLSKASVVNSETPKKDKLEQITTVGKPLTGQSD